MKPVVHSGGGIDGLSILLCSYNGARTIARAVEALDGQQNKGIPFEVVVVDNNSRDGSAELARQAWTRSDAELRVVEEARQGLSHARARGLAESRFDAVTFVDDDNCVAPDWVCTAAAVLEEHPEVAVVGGHNRVPEALDTPPWFADYMEAYGCGEQGAASGYVSAARAYVWGAGMTVRREALDRVVPAAVPLLLTGRRGSRAAAGEDLELCLRCLLAGWKIWYAAELGLDHHIAPSRLNLKTLRRQFHGFGMSDPVLDIYRRLLRGSPPERYPVMLRSAIYGVLAVLLRNGGSFVSSSAEGHVRASVTFCRRLGGLQQLVRLGRRYHRMAVTVQGLFAK